MVVRPAFLVDIVIDGYSESYKTDEPQSVRISFLVKRNGVSNQYFRIHRDKSAAFREAEPDLRTSKLRVATGRHRHATRIRDATKIREFDSLFFTEQGSATYFRACSDLGGIRQGAWLPHGISSSVFIVCVCVCVRTSYTWYMFWALAIALERSQVWSHS